MRAARVHKHGGPNVVQLDTVPAPALSADTHVLVDVERAGLNFIDTYFRTGLYGSADDLPIILGKEAAGVVVEAGAASGVAVGARVACLVGSGAYAGRVVADARSTHVLPDDLSFDDGAASLIQGLTAHYLASAIPIPSQGTVRLAHGATALVHAAAGGTGALLVQVAKLRGARVLGTVSSERKKVLALSAGADDVLVCDRAAATGTDFAHWCREKTAGRGVDIVFDGIGASTYMQSLDCLRSLGMLVVFGNASGAVPPVDPFELSKRGSLFLTRPVLFDYIHVPRREQQCVAELFDWIQSGAVRLSVYDRVFSLKEAAAAHKLLESGQSTGKILFDCQAV